MDTRGSSDIVMLWFKRTEQGQLYAVLVASLVKQCKDGYATSLHYVMQRLIPNATRQQSVFLMLKQTTLFHHCDWHMNMFHQAKGNMLFADSF